MIFPKITTFPQYWEDGMKLNATHFQQLEASIEDAVRDSRALATSGVGSYGILPMSPLILRNSAGSNPQSVRIVLESCRAIMPGGYRVEILQENVQQQQLPLKFPMVEFSPIAGIRFHIFLIINDKRRVPGGVPQSMPIRYPYLTNEYALECLPQDKLSMVMNIAANRMKIAEWQDGKILESYIPATLTIQGFPLLERWYQFFQNQLANITRAGVQVIQEQRSKDAVRVGFCMPIVQYIRSSQGYFRWTLPQSAPVNLVAYYGNLAGLVESLIETSDRDFVRNQLRDGMLNQLRPNIHDLFKLKMPQPESLGPVMGLMQRFGEALLLTLKNLVTHTAPKLKSGDGNNNIASG